MGDFVSSVGTELTGAVGSAMPIIGGIFATIAGIGLGMKLFKKVTG